MNRKTLIALVLLAVILVAGAALGGRFGLEDLRENLAMFGAWMESAPLITVSLFFVVYVAVTALSLPFASLMTLAAGALFGLVYGTILVSFASSLGATLAFLAARYLLRDSVAARFGDRLSAINEGMARDGGFYLFSLRLIPVVPFFVVNLLMGLTSIRASTFYWVSQLAMFPATIVYVNAGTQLSQISDPSDILSPGLIGSFVLLALFPWIAKLALTAWKKQKLYSRWPKPKSFDRNLIVIGAGAAGLVSTYIAAAVKAKVTLVEAHKMGGDCLNYGCVPSKALIKSAKLAQQMRNADNYGLHKAKPEFSFRAVMARVHDIIAKIEPNDSVERYTKLGAEVLEGYARIIDPWTVEITFPDGTKRRLTTRAIIIATGAAPFVPPLPGIEESGYLTSDTLWEHFAKLDEPPKRMVVLGGGPIGSELAQAFARLGSDVSQIEMGPRILAREDEDVSALAKTMLEADGVKVMTGHKALSVGLDTDGTRFILVEHQGVESRVPFDALVCAVGRSARLKGFGLEELGIPVHRTVDTNAYLETIFPNILAAGDVAGPYQFTHTASHQAWYASVNALFGILRKFKADYRVIPWTTFIDPEVARVGLSEQEAKEQKIPYEVSRFEMHELDRAIADSATKGFIKVLTVPGKDKILGVTIVGEHAGDLLAEYVLAMKHGLGLNKILGTIHTYPTMAEANKYVAGAWKRAHVSPRALAFLESFHGWRRGA
ncbi:FAD-dependent oxidoreductase [Peteryoungia desertarenae]|uniref:FAD-dependent oxidoreductase n=1 Tax=Peteryoungia desertarenae TaxID=1813451 RepID=A0ABX6QK65_9HYPH|nr:bifunctional TVP38/TMEM64 family protein/FAD-dependent oxidoreductase [Peteryoungia desertarenae]QLF68930.1 FAD-dependent oxidoreductase [Peteryoungia desertarenae]